MSFQSPLHLRDRNSWLVSPPCYDSEIVQILQQFFIFCDRHNDGGRFSVFPFFTMYSPLAGSEFMKGSYPLPSPLSPPFASLPPAAVSALLHGMIPGVILFLAVLAYRIAMANPENHVIAGMQNFSPVGALVLCGAAYFPRRWAIVLPFVALFITDLILNAIYHAPLLAWATVPQYVAFALIAAIGWALRGNPAVGRIFGASIVASVLFYLVTNTAAWALKPEYEGGFAAWRQALTTGLPGYAPTWQFFRNTLVSDLVFTGLFVACIKASRAPATEPSREEEVAPV